MLNYFLLIFHFLKSTFVKESFLYTIKICKISNSGNVTIYVTFKQNVSVISYFTDAIYLNSYCCYFQCEVIQITLCRLMLYLGKRFSQKCQGLGTPQSLSTLLVERLSPDFPHNHLLFSNHVCHCMIFFTYENQIVFSFSIILMHL